MAAGEIVREGDLSIRRMRDTPGEYELVATWRNQPHVREWWDPDDAPMTSSDAERELREHVRGKTGTRAAIIELRGRPIGFVQFYPWAGESEYLDTVGIDVPPGSWGLDIFIGDLHRLGLGLGTRAIRLLCDHLLGSRKATAVALGVERANHRARRAYERAGMTPTVEFLDTDTRGGRRVVSILMVRKRDSV